MREAFERHDLIVRNKELHLIDDLLDVSAIETGELVLEKEAIEVEEFLNKAIRLNGSQAERKGVRLEMQYNSPDKWVFDYHRI